MISVATTSELSQQQNDAIVYFKGSSISRHWELFFEKHSRELFPLIAASMFVKFKRNLEERYRERRVLLVCIEALWVSGFVNILVFFKKLANNF